MKNLDQPANPTDFHPQDCEAIGIDSNAFALCEFNRGLSKRERACIDLRIPESGDPELDALIEKARRQEMASKAVQGLLARHGDDDYSHDQLARYSVERAYALIEQLERTHS